MGILDELADGHEHLRKTLETQRRDREVKDAETVRYERLPLPPGYTPDRSPGPLHRLDAEVADKAAAIQSWQTEHPGTTEGAPDRSPTELKLEHNPEGQKPPDTGQTIAGPGGSRTVVQMRRPTHTPHEPQPISRRVDPAELEKLSSPNPLVHERLAAKIGGGDLFELAQARVAAAKEIEKVRAEKDGSREITYPTRPQGGREI